MKIVVSFVVRLHCEACDGKKRVPGGEILYGELVNCATCGGKGTIPGTVAFEDFVKLLKGMASL